MGAPEPVQIRYGVGDIPGAWLFVIMRYLRYRVVAAFAPGVAGEEALQRQLCTFPRAVLLYGFQPVGRTGGSVAAFGA